MKLTYQRGYLAWSAVFHGTLCEQFSSRRARPVPAGQTIYTTADQGDSVYFLRSGLVKTSVISQKGKELLLSIRRPGAIFGELSFCDGRRQEQAVAMEASEVVEICFDDLISELGKSRQAMVDMLNTVCLRLSQAHDQLLILSFEKTMERLVRKVLELAADLGDSSPERTDIAHYIKQEELAQMIAAPREVVSGLLNELRAKALVAYSRRGRLTISTKALRTYLDSITSGSTNVRTRRLRKRTYLPSSSSAALRRIGSPSPSKVFKRIDSDLT